MTRRRRNKARWAARRELVMATRQLDAAQEELWAFHGRKSARLASFPIRLFVALAIEQARQTIPTEPGSFA